MNKFLPLAVALLIGLIVGTFLIAPLLGPADPAPAVLDQPDTSTDTAAPAPVATLPALATDKPAALDPTAAHPHTPVRPPPVAATDSSDAPAKTAPRPTTLPLPPTPPTWTTTTQSAPALLGGQTFGTLVVEVVDSAGTPLTDGELYAVKAGSLAPNRDGAVMRHTIEDDAEQFHLQLPKGHRFDVGYVGSHGHTLIPDVVVPAGGERQLTIRLAKGRPITVQFAEGESAEPGQMTVLVYLAPDQPANGHDYPGRGQTASLSGPYVRMEATGPAQSHPLPPGRYTPTVIVQWKGRSDPNVPRRTFVASPASVAPGETVTLTSVVMGLVRLSLTSTGAGKPKDRCRVIAVRHPIDPTQYIDVAKVQAEQFTRNKNQTVVQKHLPPGTYHLEWGGRQVRGGRTVSFDVRSGDVATHEGTVTFGARKDAGDPTLKFYDARRRAWLAGLEPNPAEAPDPQPLRIPPPFDPRPANEFESRETLIHTAFRAEGENEADGYYHHLELEEFELPLSADELARLLPLVITSGGGLASRPLAPAGPYAAKLLPAGLLLLVPENPGVHDADMGRSKFSIARADGAALPYSPSVEQLHDDGFEEYRPRDVAGRVPLGLGYVIGPLPEGRHRFVVYRGDIPLGSVETDVVAGAIRALPIR